MLTDDERRLMQMLKILGDPMDRRGISTKEAIELLDSELAVIVDGDLKRTEAGRAKLAELKGKNNAETE